MSWNGFEHNCLLMNRAGQQFLNVGFLMDVACEADCRNVVSDDFDADGRPDLLVVSQDAPERKQTIRVLRNNWPQDLHWIGLHLGDESGRSPLGARVVAYAGGRSLTAVVVAGDSFRSQQAATVHFGLGTLDRVERLEVHWPNGSLSSIEKPDVDHYHRAPAPKPPAVLDPAVRSTRRPGSLTNRIRTDALSNPKMRVG